ncbi:MAG: ATPase domain-containing protein [Candidatus Poseidoniaceae archaeon]|jgi:flagellar protein FlaH|nr:ATPase domain-containing protein [Candidatus Poseidoniaceae archaeon]
MSSEENPLFIPHKPVEDGFPFDVETDSLADTMGLRLPNRSLYVVQGIVGAGKSLIAQRLVHGMLENGTKILVITTELTTRGWIEQMESIGYGVTEHIRDGQLMVFSRFGTIAESRSDVGLEQVLDSEAISQADVIILDSASALMPDDLDDKQRFEMMQKLRKISSEGRSIMLCVDPDEMDHKLLHSMRASSEIVLDLSTTLIGGDLKRNIVVTRFLRAAGPVQTSVGWRVEPSMGFIVDITAVS